MLKRNWITVCVGVTALALGTARLAVAAPLESGELTSIKDTGGAKDTSAKEWYDKIDIGGFVAAGWMHTDSDRPDFNTNPFQVHEVLLQVEARPWENVLAHIDYYPISWLGFPGGQGQQIGEAYGSLKNIINWNDNSLLNVKVGRINLPYGDEYTWQNTWYNPMITRGAAWWWGWDTGLEVYGKVSNYGYIFALTNGATTISTVDAGMGSKVFSAKLYADFFHSLHVEISGMSTGLKDHNVLWQGYRHFTTDAYTVNAKTGAVTYAGLANAGNFGEIMAKYSYGTRGYLKGEFGVVDVNDSNPDYENHLLYYLGEALVNITDQFYVVGRYSAIGTNSGDTSYPISDGMAAATVTATTTFSRWGFGLGYKLNVATLLKVEASMDNFQNQTGFAQVGNSRSLLAFEGVVKF